MIDNESAQIILKAIKELDDKVTVILNRLDNNNVTTNPISQLKKSDNEKK